jgi:phosphatidyl-myo-inositol dimannoside synthase
MRLLEITNDFPPQIGGIENYTYSLVSRWPGEAVVLTRQTPGSDAFDARVSLDVVRMGGRTLLPLPGLFRRARDLIRSRGIDAVHFSGPFPLPLIGPRLLRETGVPYSVSVHGGEFVLTSTIPVARTLMRRALSGAAVVLAESQLAAAHARAFLGAAAPVEHVPAGVDLGRFDKDVASAVVFEAGARVVLFAGRLIERKGAANLIRALPRILERHPSARLLIAGDGPGRTKLEQLARAVAADRVTFAGPVTWEGMPSYFATADIFAMPTRTRFGGLETEGLPLVLLEAAAAMVPIVAGDAGSVRDFVAPEGTGLLIDGADPRSIADAINRLLDDPEAAVAMGKRARELVENEFTWDAVAARFVKAIEKHAR